MSRAASHRGPLVLSLGFAVLALGAVAILLAAPLSRAPARTTATGGYDVARMVLYYATLPRLAIAVLCGAGLGASGAVLQQVLRNPLASPTTLGIDAGARLALTLATLLAPGLLAAGRDAVALLGSAASTLAVFTLVRGRRFSALSIVLAGLAVSLYCGALSAVLVLVKDRLLASLFIWGSGSLSQQSWDPTVALAWRLGFSALPLVLLLRPLSLLDLGDESALALGLSATRVRVAAIGAAVALSAFVTSAVGVIGFVGLVAPGLARLSGARRFDERLLWSTVIGALLLLATDATLQLASGVSSEFLPTGALTAVIGSPVLLILLPRLKATPSPASLVAAGRTVATARRAVALGAVAALALLAALAAVSGRAPSGEWRLVSLDAWDAVMIWRLPRMVAAASAGALLGVAGLILQRLTGNELASPELLGVSAGATLAIAISLFGTGGVGGLSEGAAATAGAVVVLAAILAFGSRSRFAPERVLLAGIALGALVDAAVGALSATGDPRAVALLARMSGATAGTTPDEAARAALATGTLVALALLTARWLAILPLGEQQARALGVSVARSRFLLLLLAAGTTAAATRVVGPLTFVGLMAPHLALALGIRRALPSLLGSAVGGAGVMALADGMARAVAFPLQLPTGLVAAMLGAPFLMMLLGGRSVSA